MPVDEEGREPGERGYEGPAKSDDSKSAPGKPGGKMDPKEKKKTTLMVVFAAIGVFIGFLALRKSSSSSTSSPTTGSSGLNPANYPSTGTVAGATGDPGNVGAGYATYLMGLQNEISQLSAASGQSGSLTSGSSPYGTYSGSGFDLPGAGSLTYVIDKSTGAIYQILPNGTPFHLNPQQWAEVLAGNPDIKPTPYASSSVNPPPSVPTPKVTPHAPIPR